LDRGQSLTSALALATLGTYLLFYTPLKRQTPLCTWWGRSPALYHHSSDGPPVRNGLSGEAWVLYAILFLWQFPHLLAIAWMYREDYARAGLQMLPRHDLDGRATVRQIIACTLALLPVSLIPALTGHAGKVYLVGAGMLGGVSVLRRAHGRPANERPRQAVADGVDYLPTAGSGPVDV